MAPDALRLAGVDVLYGDSHVLHGVDLTLGAGRLVALLGRNGAGKTTCLNAVVGLLTPRRGTIRLFDAPIAGLAAEERSDVQALLAAIPRDITIVMIEHDMDVALAFAEQITVLHYGQVIVEGTRASVVADPRTREVYLDA